MSIWGNAITLGSSGGGSGPSASDAILTVTAPAGATVTATKGAVSLTPTLWTAAADATLECALFVIPTAQFDSSTPWTVTASGSDTLTATVIIDSNKQYDVDLYNLYFVRDGFFNSNYTHDTRGASLATFTEDVGGAMQAYVGKVGNSRTFVYFSPQINLSGQYKTLVMDCQVRGYTESNNPAVGIVSTLPSGGGGSLTISFLASKRLITSATDTLTARQVYTVDISAQTGNVWVGFSFAGSGSYTGELLCYDLYLTKDVVT